MTTASESARKEWGQNASYADMAVTVWSGRGREAIYSIGLRETAESQGAPQAPHAAEPRERFVHAHARGRTRMSTGCGGLCGREALESRALDSQGMDTSTSIPGRRQCRSSESNLNG
eukprot:356348-Chlamydomonas_euryale.AAC.25